MPLLFCDLETYSPVDLKTAGTHAYAEHAEVMLFAYAFGVEGAPRVWDATTGAPMPDDLAKALSTPTVMTVWHNGGMFDRVILRHALGIDLPVRRVHDTMVCALAHGLPGSLGTLCEIFNIDAAAAKSTSGKSLIPLFCKPRTARQNIRRYTRDTHPVEWADFMEYARKDISAMQALYTRLPRWNYCGAERELWYLDQNINDRGFQVDTDLARKAVYAVAQAQSAINARVLEETEGDVGKASQRDQMLAYILEAHGIELPDMRKATLEKLVADPDLPEAVRAILALRLEGSMSSTSKYKKLMAAVSRDGRLRGCLQFCGASRTGRWAGRTFQPQNLPRPKIGDLRDDELRDAIDDGINAIKSGCADLVTDRVMEVASAAIRGCITAPQGRKLVVSDLSNIEGRMAAWLAGEIWKLDAFRAFDSKQGPDLYKLAYAKSFGIHHKDVTKAQRQIGKIQELSMQNQGGVGAFVTFAAVYNIDLDRLAEEAWPTIPAAILQESRSFREWAAKNKNPLTRVLSERAFIVCDAFKRMWREAHPAISSYWLELEEVCAKAIHTPGKDFGARRIGVRRDGAWLRITLPSGRQLCYAAPELKDGKLSYMGINQFSRKWQRLKTYGGKLFENITQAAARDVMAYGMPNIDNAGYEIILTVHDELLTEAADTPAFTHEGLSRLMATPPPWADDIPLAASGFEGYRYRKD